MGLNGGVAAIVFKVCDANGNELSTGWIDTDANISDRGDLGAEMAKRGIEVANGKGYNVSIDLSSYFASNEKVTVKLALVAAGAPEGSGDIYVYMGEFTNIAKAN